MPAQLTLIYGLWAAWSASWLLAAVWSARTERRISFLRDVPHRFFTALGAVILFTSPIHLAAIRSLPEPFGDDVLWAMTGFVAFGFLFAWWARIHLGRLWSGNVVKKEGHHVVDTGPYGIVRHPIYTGILISCFATAAAKGTALAFGGASLMVLGWYLKARQEERLLRDELGQDAYRSYAARVPMLVPFLPF
jgi:protein-S-isoprenylcysteine O-methyltransferase Ste14